MLLEPLQEPLCIGGGDDIGFISSRNIICLTQQGGMAGRVRCLKVCMCIRWVHEMRGKCQARGIVHLMHIIHEQHDRVMTSHRAPRKSSLLHVHMSSRTPPPPPLAPSSTSPFSSLRRHLGNVGASLPFSYTPFSSIFSLGVLHPGLFLSSVCILLLLNLHLLLLCSHPTFNHSFPRFCFVSPLPRQPPSRSCLL